MARLCRMTLMVVLCLALILPSGAAGAATPETMVSGTPQSVLKWIIQFDGPIRAGDKAQVISLGCRLIEYLPDFAFLAAMDDDTRQKVGQLPFVISVTRFEPADKLPGNLQGGAPLSIMAAETVRVILKLDDGASLLHVLAVVQQLGGEVLDVGPDILRVTVQRSALTQLAALEEVIWINEFFDMEAFNDTTSWVIQSNQPGNTAIWNKGVRGEGEVVAIGDTGLDFDMPWFRDATDTPIGPTHRKIVGYDTTYGDDYDAGSPGHGTHVTGTVAGNRMPVDGEANATGMAPMARVFLQDLTVGGSNYVLPPSDLGLLFTSSYAAGARLHTDSWGNGDNSYSTFAATADRYLWEHKDFLAFFAAGNAGSGTYSVGNPATAKNIISVGATYNGANADNMASFSSNGPTADGRISPTVTAPGVGIVSADSDGLKQSFNSGTISMSGTSMATPAVAGAASLVRQYFVEGYHPRGVAAPASVMIPSAALVKALLINSARNMSGTETDGPIPSTGQGWGRVDLAAALPFVGEAGLLAVADEKEGLATGQSWSKTYVVPDGAPVKVTLVWTDYPGAVGAAKALVNDLDLTVTTPAGTVLIGNAFALGESGGQGSADRLNVEEQVLVNHPQQGPYTVTVTGYNVPFGPQPFAVVITGASGVSSRGALGFDRSVYNAAGTVHIQVADVDLNQDETIAEQVTVRVASAIDANGEDVVLTESAPASAIFNGALRLAAGQPISGDGILQVADNDVITGVYLDSDDGSGSAATVTATAAVENVPPVITDARVTGLTDTASVIAWTTNEPAGSTVLYGETPSLGGELSDRRLVTEHTMELAGLEEAVTYYAALVSTDEAGNVATFPDLVFTTRSLPPSLTATSSAGIATTQPSTVISGVSTDPSGVVSVTINGIEAPYRRSDGYFSQTFTLEIGTNFIEVKATDTLGNSATLVLSVTRYEPADLYMTSVAGPESGVQGGSITVTDTVCNNGPGEAANFRVGYYLSADQALSGDDLFIGSRSVSILESGACASGVSEMTIPAAAPGGHPYFLAVADYTNVVEETSEANNLLAGNQIGLTNGILTAPATISAPAMNSTGSFLVSWSSSNVFGATYLLEMSRDGGAYAEVYSGTSTVTTITVGADGLYTFRVRAVKTDYTGSPYSNTASCRVTLGCGTPATLSVPATNTTGAIHASWSSSSVSGVTYVLEMSRDGGSFLPVYNGTSTVATVTFSADGTYTFRVKATKQGYADSPYSVTRNCQVSLICGTPATISVPATNSTGNIRVSWSSSSVSGVTYVLEMSREGADYVAVYTGSYTWADVPVSSGGLYTFRVKAGKSGYADSAYSAVKSCQVTLICGTPGSINVPVSNSTGSFQASWSYISISGATYVLEMSRNGGAYSRVYSGTYAFTTVTVAADGTYAFRVKATKSGYADSAYSVARNCQVTLVCGTPGTINLPATNSTGNIQVSWSNSNVSGVTYILEMSRNGGVYATVYSGAYAFAGVTFSSNGTYTFRVKATRSGYADSAYSVTRSCVVTLVCGTPPTINVPATNTTGAFRVSWSATNVSGADYQLEMSKDGGAFASVYSGIYTSASVAVSASGTYTFRVKASKSGYADSAWKVSSGVAVQRQ